ncbi:MAG: YeeE/YedE family protein [Epulopiscium sp.]|nr:YeeE/YedE family protein [Candidatus Epulonipiscium sp.]
MKKNRWILHGMILGTVFFLAALVIKPIGVSTQFSVLTGMVHSVINPNVITEDSSRDSGYKSTNAYYDKSDGKLAKNIKHPINYDFIFVLAIPAGAYVAYLLNRKRKSSEIPYIGEVPELPKQKQSFLKTYIPSFIGGFLILFGARMADGCTSGHMMSGMMQGSVSGYLFAAAVFAVAIPTAIIMERKSLGKVGK